MIQKKRTSMHSGMETPAAIVSKVSAPSNKSGAIRAICVSLIFLFAACGSSSSDKTVSQNTSSLSFKINWVTKGKPGAGAAGPNEAASIDCAALGVDKVWAAISGGSTQNNNLVALGGPWNCTDGQGVISLSGLLSGVNSAILVQGQNASGNVVYAGSKSIATLDPTTSQDAGTVTVSAVSGTMAALSSGALGQVFEKYNSTGVVSTFAGTAGSSGWTDGTGTAARFNNPKGITADGTNLYVTDNGNHTIRKVVIATGVVTTIAGTAGSSGNVNGTGTAASFNGPYGITNDGTNLYIADTANNAIRKVVIATGAVTTLAAGAGYPQGITTDGTNLYVTDGSSIRKIVIATGVATTFAGGYNATGWTDGTGTAARFNGPEGITTDGTNLYVADTQNNTIRQMVIATGVVTTLAGTPGTSGFTDGTGTSAIFGASQGITTDNTNLYVADNYRAVRKVVIATGVVTSMAGLNGYGGSTDGASGVAGFNRPAGIAINGSDLYVADTNNHTIRKIQP